MSVPNKYNSSMSGRKHHLLDDHREMVDYQQVAVLVHVLTHELAHILAPVRALWHMDYKQTEPTPLGKERNISHEREQVVVTRRNELMLVFFKKPIWADTDRCAECPWIYQQHHNRKKHKQFFYF